MKNIIFLMAISLSQFAGAIGNEGGGGGDPRPGHVVNWADDMLNYLKPNVSEKGMYAVSAMRERLEKLEASLDTPTPMIRFHQVDQIMDCKQDDQKIESPKQGCTREDGSIDFSGLTWDKANDKFKCEVVTQELLVGIILKGRYRAAISYCQGMLAEQESKKVSATKKPKSCEIKLDDGVKDESAQILVKKGYSTFRSSQSKDGLVAKTFKKCGDWEDMACGGGGFEIFNDYCRSIVRPPRGLKSGEKVCLTMLSVYQKQADREYHLWTGKIQNLHDCEQKVK